MDDDFDTSFVVSGLPPEPGGDEPDVETESISMTTTEKIAPLIHPSLILVQNLIEELQRYTLHLSTILEAVQTLRQRPNNSGLTSELVSAFPVYVGNSGVDMLSSVFYDYLYSHGLARDIDPLLIQYVLTMAYVYRVISTNKDYLKTSYKTASFAKFKESVEDIPLPRLFVKYLQSIGVVTNPNGVTVIPFGRNIEELFPQDNQQQISPLSILVRAGRSKANNEWCLDTKWLQEWKTCAKTLAKSILLTHVDYSALEGSYDMLVTYNPKVDVCTSKLVYQALAPIVLGLEQAKLAACFGYRDYKRFQHWLSCYNEILFPVEVTDSFDPKVYLRDKLARTI